MTTEIILPVVLADQYLESPLHGLACAGRALIAQHCDGLRTYRRVGIDSPGARSSGWCGFASPVVPGGVSLLLTL